MVPVLYRINTMNQESPNKQCCTISLEPEEENKLLQMIKALSNPVRFSILKYLTTHEGCINSQLVANLPIAQATTSQHLEVLKDAGFVISSPNGAATCYKLDPHQIILFQQLINKTFKTKKL